MFCGLHTFFFILGWAKYTYFNLNNPKRLKSSVDIQIKDKDIGIVRISDLWQKCGRVEIM